jgi:hypothetical protein
VVVEALEEVVMALELELEDIENLEEQLLDVILYLH